MSDTPENTLPQELLLPTLLLSAFIRMADPAQSPKLSKLHNEPPSPQPGRSMASIQTGTLGHRASFAEGMRNVPPSPRQRHPSLTQSAVQDLLNHPAHRKPSEAQFVGKDWRQIKCGQLVSSNDVTFVEKTTAVEEATKVGWAIEMIHPPAC